MNDIVATAKENRSYYCACGWYYHPTANKWARIKPNKVKVLAHGNTYLYNRKPTTIVISLNKEVWDKVRQDQVPLEVYNVLEG
jgi:N-acetylneuraminic acid mutarotase